MVNSKSINFLVLSGLLLTLSSTAFSDVNDTTDQQNDKLERILDILQQLVATDRSLSVKQNTTGENSSCFHLEAEQLLEIKPQLKRVWSLSHQLFVTFEFMPHPDSYKQAQTISVQVGERIANWRVISANLKLQSATLKNLNDDNLKVFYSHG